MSNLSDDAYMVSHLALWALVETTWYPAIDERHMTHRKRSFSITSFHAPFTLLKTSHFFENLFIVHSQASSLKAE